MEAKRFNFQCPYCGVKVWWGQRTPSIPLPRTSDYNCPACHHRIHITYLKGKDDIKVVKGKEYKILYDLDSLASRGAMVEIHFLKQWGGKTYKGMIIYANALQPYPAKQFLLRYGNTLLHFKKSQIKKDWKILEAENKELDSITDRLGALNDLSNWRESK